ncbi:hypothetical protein AVEN_7010-1 [Araneus ventricosus]|uniref:Uncharacterized protein n=1 Tax=Araneus ventricosus TaxID=182803 RepID=A0A4Y2IDX5_ARAVE|nr:hypothetical protein AVEN_7010-1 [Araneus ventricosus]
MNVAVSMTPRSIPGSVQVTSHLFINKSQDQSFSKDDFFGGEKKTILKYEQIYVTRSSFFKTTSHLETIRELLKMDLLAQDWGQMMTPAS